MAKQTVPFHLVATASGNVLVQDMENRRIERLALAEAARDQLGVYFLPLWIVDGHDVSEEMLAWPDGTVTTAAEYTNWENSRRRAYLGDSSSIEEANEEAAYYAELEAQGAI